MVSLRSGERLVIVERSGVVESVHTGHLIVLAPDGRVVSSRGEPDQPVFARSSLKPLQAVAMVRAGLVADDPELALAAASHSGSALHRNLIEAELRGAGFTEHDLECPPQYPIGDAERDAYVAQGLRPSRLAMNCSGKHTAMLRTCLARNEAAGAAPVDETWTLSGYVSPTHPLQVAIASTVSELTGDSIAATGIDGCGAPLFAVTVTGLARAFQRIAREPSGDSAEYRVAEAMRLHPELVAGVGRSATRLMTGIPGLIAKDGAEGVYAAALGDGGAVAVKIDDGALRAAERAIVVGLRALGVSAPVLDELAEEPVPGGGVPVGAVRAITPDTAADRGGTGRVASRL
jgi:L-asparaginase II